MIVTGSGPHAGDQGAKRNHLDPEAIAQVHADLVFLLVGLSVALWFALRAVGAPRSAVRAAAALVLVELAQGLIGFVQYFTHLPAALVAAHMLGASLVWTATLAALWSLRERPTAAEPTAVEPTAVEPTASRRCPATMSPPLPPRRSPRPTIPTWPPTDHPTHPGRPPTHPALRVTTAARARRHPATTAPHRPAPPPATPPHTTAPRTPARTTTAPHHHPAPRTTTPRTTAPHHRPAPPHRTTTAPRRPAPSLRRLRGAKSARRRRVMAGFRRRSTRFSGKRGVDALVMPLFPGNRVDQADALNADGPGSRNPVRSARRTRIARARARAGPGARSLVRSAQADGHAAVRSARGLVRSAQAGALSADGRGSRGLMPLRAGGPGSRRPAGRRRLGVPEEQRRLGQLQLEQHRLAVRPGIRSTRA